MDELDVDLSANSLTAASGRRAALHALGVAGMAAIASGSLVEGSDAAKRRGNRQKRQRQRHRAASDGASAEKKKGKAGPPGPTGPTGPVGPTGPAGGGAGSGTTGPTGPTGPTGDQGSPGPAGATGATGATGDPGPAGVSGAQSAVVLTMQSTGSTTFTDLATPGPAVSVTVPASGRVLVLLTAWMHVTQEQTAVMSFASSGGSGDVDADPTRAISAYVFSNSDLTGQIALTTSAAIPLAGLSPGSHTFTAKYRSDNGLLVAFRNRSLTVIPLP